MIVLCFIGPCCLQLFKLLSGKAATLSQISLDLFALSKCPVKIRTNSVFWEKEGIPEKMFVFLKDSFLSWYFIWLLPVTLNHHREAGGLGGCNSPSQSSESFETLPGWAPRLGLAGFFRGFHLPYQTNP